MTDIEERALIERLRQRTSNSHMLLSNPPKPAPDRDCHTAADMLEAALAFKQEVSDALVWYFGSKEGCVSDALRDFIIPAPKPDPLVEALNESGVILAGPVAKDLRAALEARGFEIRSKNDD